MKILADYHNHTIYSCGNNENRRHATGTVEDNVKVAIEKGLKEIGISEHGFGHYLYGITRKNAKKQREEIDRLNKKYPEINILMGIESNILDDSGKLDIPEDLLQYFDYVLAGYHYGTKPTSFKNFLHHLDNMIFKGLFSKEYNTRAVINAMKNNKIKYITHPGDKARVDIERIAKVAEETGTGLEINGHHRKLNPEMIKAIRKYNLKYYIGSDAHRPEHIANFDKGFEIAKEAGLEIDKIVNVEE